jgi:hypothetical protein
MHHVGGGRASLWHFFVKLPSSEEPDGDRFGLGGLGGAAWSQKTAV